MMTKLRRQRKLSPDERVKAKERIPFSQDDKLEKDKVLSEIKVGINQHSAKMSAFNGFYTPFDTVRDFHVDKEPKRRKR